MGLGGYLAWTAAAREIVNSGKASKVLPCEIHGEKYIKIVDSEVWLNNPYVTLNHEELKTGCAIPLQLNNPHTNYCKLDTPEKAYHRYDKHIIEQICEYYQTESPVLKCELYFTEKERDNITNLRKQLEDRFIAIEPHSKTNYTFNRVYPFDKWQSIVDELSKKIQVVQVGRPGSRLLKGVHDMTGKTTFREAALLIGEAEIFLSTEGGLTHAATCTDTPALVVLTGYQHEKMVAYPQNININIARHGPCGLKQACSQCESDAQAHEWREVVTAVEEALCL